MEKKWLDEELIFPSFKAYIDRLAKGLNLPPVVVIQNMMIRRLAEENAMVDVGGSSESLLGEFIAKDGELVTGEELYNIIYQNERKQLELDRVDQLQGLLTQYSDPVKFWNNKMSETDKDIMRRRGILPDKIKEQEGLQGKDWTSEIKPEEG